LDRPIDLPQALQDVSDKQVLSIEMPADFDLLREHL